MSLKPEETEENESRITPEEYLAEQKRAIRRRSFRFLGGGVLITAFLLFALVLGFAALADLFNNILFILGLFFLGGGVWGIYYAKKLTLKDLIPSPEAIEFLRQAQDTKPYFSYILVGGLVVVTLFQLRTENVESVFYLGEKSGEIAGLIKPLVWEGEYWRLLTAATLHGIFPVHLYLNAQALYGFGGLIESLSNRAHLAIVFLLSIIGGGLLSLFFMPDVQSIGASGGIMGLIGYMAIFGYRRKRQLPPDFLKSMLINIGFIAAFGVIAYQIIDNFAHLGGLITGAIYGFVQIPENLHKNPRSVGTVTEIFGLIALGVFIFTCILTVLLLTKTIGL
ncbi:MAG TPA: rhomboid family intramembrane serine protease [Pyrinomonadaceae bacterium]|nr:rhomboid family intramembrane serine protease [Pyrinomonadaceae bacterium]